MIPTHRSALAYPNRRGCQPLKMFFLRRRKYLFVISSILLIWVLVRLVQSRDKGPVWQPIYHPFNLPSSNAAVADTRIQSIASQAALSDDCVEQWIAHGIWGSCKVDESRIDLIYTWVNVSGSLTIYTYSSFIRASIRDRE
jgi:hypothetical protein